MERWISGWSQYLLDSWSTATPAQFTTLATAVIVTGWMMNRFFSR